MHRRRELAIGLILLIGGLVVVAVGTIFPASDPLVALGWLQVVPSLVSMCGVVFVLVSLARRAISASPSATISRIIVWAGVAGLGLALAYGVAGGLSQVPDWLAGLNGTFIPGPQVGLSAFIVLGFGLFVGLVIGAIGALTWWNLRGRHVHATPVESH